MQDDLLLRRAHASAHHGTDGANKTDTENQPGVGSHETITPSVCVKGASSDTDDTNSEASVEESVVQVGAFEWRHAAIFSGFAVEDEAVVKSAFLSVVQIWSRSLDGKKSTTEDGTAIEKALGEVSRGGRVGEDGLLSELRRALECAGCLEGAAEGCSR
jgi:hypothetical protein